MIYALYHNKKTGELIITNCTFVSSLDLEKYQVRNWNENYYLANNRKVLRKLAKHIQEQWIAETEERLNKLKTLKIVTKY